MSTSRAASLLLVAATVVGLTACVRPPPGQYGQTTGPYAVTTPVAPPPPQVEVVPPPVLPPERVVWVPGHWVWDGHQHVWESGRYEERPQPRAEYEAGHWT